MFFLSPQTNLVSIRTDTSHWLMKWIPPSQNWLVIKHMHNMKQQVKYSGSFMRVASLQWQFGRLFTSRDSAFKSFICSRQKNNSHIFIVMKFY